MLLDGCMAAFLADLTSICRQYGVGHSGDIFAMDLNAMPGFAGYAANWEHEACRSVEDEDLARAIYPDPISSLEILFRLRCPGDALRAHP